MFNYEFKIFIKQIHIVTVAVLLVYASIYFLIKNIEFNQFDFLADKVEMQKNEPSFEIDMVASIGEQTHKQLRVDAPDGLIAENPHIYILKVDEKNSRKGAAQSLDDFFKTLTKKDTAKSVEQRFDIKSVGVDRKILQRKTVVVPARKNERINYKKLFKKKFEKEKKSALLNQKQLRQKVVSHYPSFQVCYEKALLKDELLSGNAEVVLRIGAGGNVNFKGLGRKGSINELKSCLVGVGKKIKFEKVHLGKTVKFSLFFNS